MKNENYSKKKDKVIVIGTGQGYTDFLGPALASLEEIEIIGTVDIMNRNLDNDPAPKVPHYLREENQRLSDLLSPFKEQDPIVFLEHAVDFHTPDAKDLVQNGYRVIIEKPYAITLEQQEDLESLVIDSESKVALLEYYVSMKTAPARLGLGHIKPGSFYFTQPDTLLVERSNRDLENYSGTLTEMTGNIKYLNIAVLEGEGNTGRVHHRGAHVTDSRLGGGMINDLGLHAFGPLLGFREIIGDIDPALKSAKIRTARCKEYIEMAKEVFGLDEEFIGDSYAEIDLKTDKDVLVNIKLGKYTPLESNIRYVKLMGDKGTVTVDMNDCFVKFEDNSRVRAPKTELKYTTVIRSALAELSGDPAYTRDTVTEVGLQGQRMILSILDRGTAYLHENDVRYDYGKRPQFLSP